MKLEHTIKMLSNRFNIPINYTPYHYQVSNFSNNIPVSAAIRRNNSSERFDLIIYNAKDYATDKQIITTIIHELGHLIDGTTDWRDIYFGVNSDRMYHDKELLIECEKRAWTKAIELADELNIELCYDVAYHCLQTYYKAEIELINERRNNEKK